MTTTGFPSVAAARRQAVSLRDKVDALRQPGTYPERTHSVGAIETHVSWVFLTDLHAFKLKKPVRTPYLDFRTLADRRTCCLAEIDVNRPLAADVYLGVVPLTLEADNRLAVAGSGEVVDWLVKSRRLADDRMLNHAIENGTVTDAAIRAVAGRLARFYAATTVIPLSADAYCARLRADLEEQTAGLEEAARDLPQSTIATVARTLHSSLDREPDLFAARARQSRVVDAHGDLKPEHVILEPEPKIIDRIEFNASLRQLDAVDDLGYLALECDRLGASWIGDLVLATYGSLTGDMPPARLVAFYKALRACLHAKLAAWHVHEPREVGRAHWLAKARDYLELAERHSAMLA